LRCLGCPSFLGALFRTIAVKKVKKAVFLEWGGIVLARLACHLVLRGHWLPMPLYKNLGGSANACLFYGGVTCWVVAAVDSCSEVGGVRGSNTVISLGEPADNMYSAMSGVVQDASCRTV
jgi:hypothetical protein